MRSFAVINPKGGCGKTTTAINLAATFAGFGHKTLLVDMDPQGHCALGLAVPDSRLEASIAEALLAAPGRFDLHDALWQINGNLDLIPSAPSLHRAARQLNDLSDRAHRLSTALAPAHKSYDLCVIDTPPHLGLLTLCAMAAASDVLIPVESGYFSLQSAMRHCGSLQILADRLQHTVAFHVLATLHDGRTRIGPQILQELGRHFGQRLIAEPVHFSNKLREAASFGQPITEYDPEGRSCQDFKKLARALLSSISDAAPQRLNTDQAPDPQDHWTEIQSLQVPASSPASPASSAAVAAPQAPTATSSRVADLVLRARALADRTQTLQQKLGADPLLKRLHDRLGDETTPAPGAAQQVSRLFGVRTTSQGVLFVQPAEQARGGISIVGDFNGWSPEATPLQFHAQLNVWQACVPLPPGRYLYQLMADGKSLTDPHNPRVEQDESGLSRSVLDVEPSL